MSLWLPLNSRSDSIVLLAPISPTAAGSTSLRPLQPTAPARSPSSPPPTRHRHRRVRRQGTFVALPQEKARPPHQQHAPLRARAGRPRVSVLYHFTPGSHGQGLLDLQQHHHVPALTMMIPAERELRLDLSTATAAGLKLEQLPDTTWLSPTRRLPRRLRRVS